MGPLMGSPHCRLLILRNGNVLCHFFQNFAVDLKKSPMSPVDFEKWQCSLSLFSKVRVDFEIVQCRLSILRNGNVPCRYFRNFTVNFAMWPVGFKKRLCRPVKFRGQGYLV